MKTTLLTLSGLLLIGCSKAPSGPPSAETRLEKYTSVLSEWRRQDAKLVEHFPPAIPIEVTAARLSASPGYLQGGAWLQIRLTLPPGRVETAFREASARAKAFYDGGDALALLNERKDGMPGASFHTAATEDGDFPMEYRIFVYDAQPYGEGDTFRWNHGKSSGVVVSKTHNEIIYFAESW